MIGAFLLVLLAQAATDPEPLPYNLAGPATVEGAKLTVAKMLKATKDKDNPTYDKIARGMVVMLAPDFGMPVDRAKFEQSLTDCTAPQVISSRPFPIRPEVQAVRIAMKCTDKDHPRPFDAIADIMADNEHTFAVMPGGVESVWPPKKGKP